MFMLEVSIGPAGLHAVSDRLCHRSRQRLEISLPLLQKWRRSLFSALYSFPHLCWRAHVHVGGFHWTISLSRRPWHFQDFANFQGSRLRRNSDGMLAECLLHRCPLLGPLLLLVLLINRSSLE